MVKKLEGGGSLADEATAVGSKVESAKNFKREASVAGVPSGAITAAFRVAKDGIGQSGSGSEFTVFKVTDVVVPAADMASDEVKKLQDTLQRGLADEQVAQYVTQIQSDIGTSINQAALAQVTGANN